MGNSNDGKLAPLCACRLGIAAGILWGLGALVIGIASIYTEVWGHKVVELVGNVYWGYKATWGGAFIGAGWAFVDAFIGLAILIGIYNLLSRVGPCCCTGSKQSAEQPPSQPQA